MLDFDPATVRIPSGHFIDGKIVGGPDESRTVRRPSDNHAYADLPLASPEVVDLAVTSAHKAFMSTDWARCAPRERARALRKWADLIEDDKHYLAQLEALGSTRPIADVVAGDVPATAETIRFFSEYADKVGGEVAATKPDNLGMVIREPLGVVAAITPWNFPLSMASWKIGRALAAGNAVVLKPSELTPFSVVRLAELAIAAGIPPGIFNIVQGTGSVTGAALCSHPNVSKITFTGSTRTGAAIMAAAAANGTCPVTLELGGKSPQIVFADAPRPENIARIIGRSFLGNAGQVCVAGSRLIVHRSIEAEMIDRIGTFAATLRAGPTWKSDTTFSPIISVQQAERIDSIVHSSLQEGAEAVIGGKRMIGIQDGIYYEPTILTSAEPDMAVIRDEIFGPVMTVQSFADEEEAFSLADHPTYGLAAGVHTADLGRAMRAVRQVQAGTVWVNRYGRSGDFNLPTGGYKHSGLGKDLGREAFESNLRSKTVLIDFSNEVFGK